MKWVFFFFGFFFSTARLFVGASRNGLVRFKASDKVPVRLATSVWTAQHQKTVHFYPYSCGSSHLVRRYNSQLFRSPSSAAFETAITYFSLQSWSTLYANTPNPSCITTTRLRLGKDCAHGNEETTLTVELCCHLTSTCVLEDAITAGQLQGFIQTKSAVASKRPDPSFIWVRVACFDCKLKQNQLWRNANWPFFFFCFFLIENKCVSLHL